MPLARRILSGLFPGRVSSEPLVGHLLRLLYGSSVHIVKYYLQQLLVDKNPYGENTTFRRELLVFFVPRNEFSSRALRLRQSLVPAGSYPFGL